MEMMHQRDAGQCDPLMLPAIPLFTRLSGRDRLASDPVLPGQPGRELRAQSALGFRRTWR